MIRVYNRSDKPALLDIFRMNTPEFFGVEEIKDFETFLDNARENYFVVVENDAIVGCGGYHFGSSKTERRISWTLFHPDYRGKGFGKVLVNECLAAIRREPTIKSICVWTSQLVYPFYEKFGFVTVEIKKDYWTKGLDLYRMEMPNHSQNSAS